ncbi:UDP-glucuronosyl/UDP-glucosyltransferase [Trema orientale]|uniref:UDP-glucuronosyl/UDP-glucosyltransferase n=1 Tax=Trema orientale TaxID=63057 RepID=A0A2P5EGP6_TREOI|nr:UDP-glucuronosyl/UDP-glucosyltransferase [Trema orientale]
MAPSGIDQTLTAEERDDVKLHIAMFPWLAFGHILPYLELAKLFAQKGHQISFISTPKNIHRLPKLPPSLSPLINLVKLPSLNLPNDSESTSDLPREKVPTLKKAHDGLRDPLSDFLQSSKPDWLLFDFAAYWVPDMARDIGLPNVYFSIFTAASLGYIGAEVPDYRTEPDDFVVAPKWVPFPSTVAYRKYEVSKVFDDLTGMDDDVSVCYRIAKALRGCHAVAVRSCWELETEWLNLLRDLLGKPVLPIGQLPPAPPPNDNEEDENDESWRSTKRWLDLQPKRSVVYVAFGSEAVPSQDELTEIALGLELSGFPFFWALRARSDSVELPTGFGPRTREQGIVCTSWAPQLKILGHDSVGGFLTHSGWSSVVEALQFGVPLVLLTFTNDQGLNAKLLQEKMIGYLVPRDENDGSFTRESVAESLKLVVEKEGGKVYKDKAKEMSPVFGDRGVQNKYVDEFLGYLKAHNTTIWPKE